MPLIVLTILLFVAVVVLALILWRVLAEQHQRSEARVAALADAIDEPRESPLWGVPSRRAPADPAIMTLFAPEGRAAMSPLALVIVGLAIGALAAMLTMSGGTGVRGAVRGENGAPGSSAIELLSMRHQLDGDTLIVSGSVRNGSAAPPRALTVVVSAFGAEDRLIASGEAPLEPSVLQPGKETTFRVTVAHTGDPDRYRLGFRADDQVVRHLDRRTDVTRAGTD